MKKLALYAFALWMLSLHASAVGSPYRFTLLAPPASAFVDQTFARGINNAGQVIGDGLSEGPRFDERAMLWSSDGTPRFLPHYGMDGRAYSAVWAINDVGQAIGSVSGSFGSDGFILWNDGDPTRLEPPAGRPVDINNAGQILLNASVPMVWDGSTLTTLFTLGGGASGAAINDNGWVAGSSVLRDGRVHATLWQGRAVLDLGTLGGRDSFASNINASGLVVGNSLMADNLTTHATLWREGDIIDLGTLAGGSTSLALAVNAHGAIVGTSTLANGHGHAVLWDGDAIIDLNSLVDAATASAGWVLQEAIGINDQGWIVGNATNTQTLQNLGFVLAPTPVSVPVPEPMTIALMLAGLAGLALRCRAAAMRQWQ